MVLRMDGKKRRVNGIKGTCALLELESFDLIKACVPGLKCFIWL